MTLNEITGEYEVITKNNRIILDTLAFGFEITRHANGRDWWLVQPCLDESRFYKVLFTPAGIYSVNMQMITPQFGNLYNDYFPHTEQNPSTIAPDGSFFVKASFEGISPVFHTPGYVIIRVYDFDRCTGILSNQRAVITDTLPPCHPWIKLCISPNSRYLYMSYCLNNQNPERESMIYQYDLSVPDFGQTKQLVAQYDGFYDSTCAEYPLFHTMQNGPDNKIYVDGKSSGWIHAIEFPDNQGLSCSFIQRKFYLGFGMTSFLPHLPNYRLGPISGSVCDSLTAGIADLKPNMPVFSVYPNPAADHVQVSWDKPSGGQCGYSLFNTMGAVIRSGSFPLSGLKYTISLSEVPEGMYFLSIQSQDGLGNINKIIVLY
ncbi:MAG TPA: T9SS type A sorting domain-containing protein [Bacteroidales bacterium]|nr:T9SS type A sorting domain-containing protein [Bacteroidales bacterium]